MKRIYVSFFTTVTVALMMTLIAFITRDGMDHMAGMDKNTHIVGQDSTSSGFTNDTETFN